MYAIDANKLVKWYRNGKEKIIAVSEISFSVNQGEIFGIIGPDGAGKTSLIRMLVTLLLPDGGNALVDGLDIVKDYKSIRQRVGYMPGKFSLYPDLTVEENLHFFATIFHTTIEKNYVLIEDIYRQIEPFKTRRAGQLSGGMKQKLALSCALIHRPVVLFLDEPTTGVDAVSRKEFWDMLQRLKQQNITILVATPYMDEAALCDRVALMQNGKFLSVGSPQQIVNAFTHRILAVKAERMFALLRDLATAPQMLNSYSFGAYHHAVMKDNGSEKELQQYLQQKGHKDVAIKEVMPNIEDCFMQLMTSTEKENQTMKTEGKIKA